MYNLCFNIINITFFINVNTIIENFSVLEADEHVITKYEQYYIKYLQTLLQKILGLSFYIIT